MLQEEFSKMEEMAGHFKAYVNTKIDQAKFGVAEKTSTIASAILARIFICLIFIFFLVFASVSAALLIGEWLGKMWAGFLIVSGIYLLLGAIIWWGREKLLRLPVMNAILRQLFTNTEEDEANKK